MILLILFVASVMGIGDSFKNQLAFPLNPILPSYPSCFTEGTTWATEESTGVISGVDSLYTCQDICLAYPNCEKFTWYKELAMALKFMCFLYEHPTTVYPCNNCISGPKSCNTTTTSTLPPTTTSPYCPHPPEPEKHGEWFCVDSSNIPTCHLECFPGYVSSDLTVITCQNGQWPSFPSCVPALALITGNSDYPHNTVEVYGPQQFYLPNLPDDRMFHTLDLVNSEVLLCGGYFSGTISSCLTLTSTQQWISHSTTRHPHYRHSSVAVLGQLYLLGGESLIRETEHLTPPSTRWKSGFDLLEGSRQSCTTKISHQEFVVTGGYSRFVVSYNVTNGAATRLQDLITSRSWHGCAYVRDEETRFKGILVAGGSGGGSRSELYDMERGLWSSTGQLTSRRENGVCMIVLGENILAMGGQDGSSALATVDRFNLTSREWKPTGEMLEPRILFAVTGVPPNAVGLESKLKEL